MSDQDGEVGHVDTADGTISVGVDHGTVAVYIGGWLSADGVRMPSAQAEQFAEMFLRCCLEAERQEHASG